MSSEFFKKVSIAASALVALAAGAFLAFGRPASAAGTVVGGFWIFLNVYFLFRVIEAGMAGRHPKNLLFLAVLKFPVLYVAGYFILKSRFFPVEGVLAGLTAFMAAFVVQWTRANLPAGRQAPQERRAS